VLRDSFVIRHSSFVIHLVSFVPQRIDGVEGGSFARRIIPEEDTDGGGEQKSDDD
jgi:hypothetical protein